MDIRKVKKLIEMLEESEIAEIEIHEGEESIRLSRQSSVVPIQTVVQIPGAASGQASRPITLVSDEHITDASTSEERLPEGHEVKAPMVGIFYEAPSPGKPPFVELGKSVVKGDVLCIIEAMKVMNQVEAETSGIIAKTMAENGEPVEYGQPLFIIREET